jgi:exosome complex exonuclease RRP6
MENPQDFKSIQDAIQAALVATTRTAGTLAQEDLSFQRSLNPDVAEALDDANARLLALSSNILKSAAALTESNVAPILNEQDDVDNHWRGIVDVVDGLLEKADVSLDEYKGVVKRKDPPGLGSEPAAKKRLGNNFRNQNLVKPQLAFEVKIDNFPTGPWRPLLENKPHAIVPLKDSLRTVTNEFGQEQVAHPYEAEIEAYDYPEEVYKVAEPIPYLPVETTAATFVDTYEGVLSMLNELKSADEIAVDLEHHDQRSYIGLVSLMQISTRKKDWIVDTLKPWRHQLSVLNEVFADPKILKVFHGAYMDIIWLQRDLGLYIVGLFDTHHACRTLGYPGGSLAYLLKRFVDFDADKQYQMADWRLRPLPEEMFFYARADTHFLLYIYDHLRNELVEKTNPKQADGEGDLVRRVLKKSTETALLRFEWPVYDQKEGRGPGGWFNQLVKSPVLLSNEQFAVFRAVHEWRDKIARMDDDSTHFVMPNHVLLNIAKFMPSEMTELYRSCHPISHSVKSRVGELLALIKEAKEEGAKSGISMMSVLKPDSVGAIAAATRRAEAAGAAGALKVGEDLRAESSAFWGSAFGSSTWDAPSTLTRPAQDITLAIPLPPVAEDAFTEGVSMLAMDEDEEEVKEEEPEPFVVDEPFTLKSGTGKRKAEEELQREAAMEEQTGDRPIGDYDMALDPAAEAAAREREERRQQRRAEKKAAKAAKLASQSASATPSQQEDEEEEEPFDYSKAESVMNRKTPKFDGANGAKGKKGGKGKKPFDPYSKSEDAKGGMRRSQSERAGKSFTFRN